MYTGSLQLVVDSLPPALASAKSAVLATGGYVGASQESNDGDRPVATITYRIPAARWDDAIGDLRGLATKVVAEQTQATEVGGQIVDLEARLRNLRASEASLQGIAQGTGKVSDLLEVEAQLTGVRGQIEQLDGQRAQLEDQVAYGTLVTTFGLEVVQVQEAAKGWDPATDVDGATATLIGAGQTLVSGTIWFGIVWLPLLVAIGLIALVVRFVGATPGRCCRPRRSGAAAGCLSRPARRLARADPRRERGPRPLPGDVERRPALERRVGPEVRGPPPQEPVEAEPVRRREAVVRRHDRGDRPRRRATPGRRGRGPIGRRPGRATGPAPAPGSGRPRTTAARRRSSRPRVARTRIPSTCSVQRVRRVATSQAVSPSATASHPIATSTTNRSSVQP